jgi:hypothetical protein
MPLGSITKDLLAHLLTGDRQATTDALLHALSYTDEDDDDDDDDGDGDDDGDDGELHDDNVEGDDEDEE